MKQENWMDVEQYRDSNYALSSAFPALMRKVFVWMTLALAITGITAFGVATSPALISAIFGSKVLFWGLIIAEFALVMGISGAISRMSLSTATLLFVLYSVVNGATLSVIFLAFSMSVIMALLGLIISTVVNLFVQSTGFDLIISYVGVLIFVGLTAYDTQKIKQMCLEAPNGGEMSQKLALLGALTLYLDFINLFLYLLRIFGRKE